jgi:hypothetical protein
MHIYLKYLSIIRLHSNLPLNSISSHLHIIYLMPLNHFIQPLDYLTNVPLNLQHQQVLLTKKTQPKILEPMISDQPFLKPILHILHQHFLIH